MAEVIVVGAGPVGTLLAAELARHDVDVSLVEKRASTSGGTRAIGIHPPVLSALEAGGATERILDEALRVRRGEARTADDLLGVVRFDRLPIRHPYIATLAQERTLAALAHGAPSPRLGVTVTRIHSTREAVRVEGLDGASEVAWRAPIVVVAGGASARTLVYREPDARVYSYRDRYLMSDVTLASDAAGFSEPVARVHLTPDGVLESFPLPAVDDHPRRRFVAWSSARSTRALEALPSDAPARVASLQRALTHRGAGAAAAAVTDASTFGIRRFVAPQLRRGRLFAIGDTAHEVSPIGGQGMNLGLLDAATLAPLLAQWVRTGEEPDRALDEWQHARVRSARLGARIAVLNTALGRPFGVRTGQLRRFALRSALRTAGATVARAYAMGFDAAAG